MTATALSEGGLEGGFGISPRRRRARRNARLWFVAIGVGLVLIVALTFFGNVSTRLRPNDDKTVQVVLPPPPPPPPPPPTVKPVEQPPEPKPVPIEQPQDTPPPPDQAPPSDPTVGDSALSAREGAGPSNYGLAVGNGGGTRIGGKVGGGAGDGFAAYANVALAAIRQATQADAALSRGRYTARLMITVDQTGRITNVRMTDSTGDAKRDAAIERRLVGLQLSQRPPAGLPVIRIQLNARS